MYSYVTQTYAEFFFTPTDFEYPVTKAVRAKVDLQVMLLKKTGEKTTKCILYSRVDPDIKLIPKSFVELGSRQSGFMPRYFAKQCEIAESGKAQKKN